MRRARCAAKPPDLDRPDLFSVIQKKMEETTPLTDIKLDIPMQDKKSGWTLDGEYHEALDLEQGVKRRWVGIKGLDGEV
jgi:hypothetical protein